VVLLPGQNVSTRHVGFTKFSIYCILSFTTD